MINSVTLQGRITREPKIEQSPKGRVYCRSRIAVEGPYRGKDVPKNTSYFTIVFFGKQAQAFYNNVAKGAFISVEGRLDQDEYTDQMGVHHDTVSVIVSKLHIHEYMRKHREIRNLDAGNEEELLVPREITKSLLKQVSFEDEDIPEDMLGGGNVDGLL